MKAVNRTRAEAQGPSGDLIQIQLGPGPSALERPSLDLDQITLGALSLGPRAIYCLHSCDISSPSLDIGEIPLGLRPRDISLKYLSASPRGISGGITLMSHIPKCDFTYYTPRTLIYVLISVRFGSLIWA